MLSDKKAAKKIIKIAKCCPEYYTKDERRLQNNEETQS